jgi:hypothetical protein
MAMFAFGPAGILRHRRPFTETILDEIRAIHRAAGPEVLFQLEMPGELVFVAQMPGPARVAAAAMLARGVARLVRQAPEGARFGVHLCLGDLAHKAFTTMKDATPLVLLANAIAKRWPAGRPLDYVHAPFAAGESPAPLDEAFYRPLARLRLPDGIRFIAGFLHESRELAEHKEILAMVERHAGRQVDLAAACGLGRRTRHAAYQTMDLAAQLS